MGRLLATAKSSGIQVTAICLILAFIGGTIAGSLFNDGEEEFKSISQEQLLTLTDRDAISGAREILGFDGTPATVEALLGDSAARTGFLDIGMLLNTSERTQVDARMALTDSIKSTLRMGKGHSSYAGARLEHTGNGIYHIYLTHGREGNALLRAMQNALPSDLNVRFHRVQHSQTFLEAKMSQVWTVLSDAEIGEHGIHTVSIDVQNNQVLVILDETIKATTGPTLANRIRSSMSGVPIRIQYSEVPQPTSCYHDSCADPMAAGIVIRKGSLSGGRCTLGFMVMNGSNTQAMTSGHCGHNENNNWYHSAYGSNAFGSEVLEGSYEYSGIDAMIVEIPEHQASNHVASCVYDSNVCVDMLGYLAEHDIENGMILNFIGGVSGHGVAVVNSYTAEWTSNTCACRQRGILLGISSVQLGDSGGPYRRSNDAVAIQSFRSGNTAYAATVDSILTYYGVVLRTS